MSEAAKHTPTPWQIGPSDCNGICTVDAVDTKDGQLFIVCEVYGIDNSRTSSPEAEANADFIIRAVNLHEQLVAALEKIRDDVAYNSRAYVIARDALAAAGAA